MRAVYIGRFQPLHRGHFRVIQEHRGEYDEFVIVVGSAEKQGERENPLSFEERKQTIQSCFPDAEVAGLKDYETDEEWAEDLVDNLDPDVAVTRNDRTEEALEGTGIEIFHQELHDAGVYSGAEIRRRIRSGEEWRYLVPECAEEKINEFVDKIKDSGIKYEFEPGWKRENAYHDTYEK